MRRPTSRADAQWEELSGLIGMVEAVSSVEERLERLSGRLIGRPYIVHPLTGSPSTPEKMVTRLDGYDCVTYVETVMALALCRSCRQFEPILKALRYDRGTVAWMARNHYMTLWIERNEKEGLISRVLSHLWVFEAGTRTLSVLEGYPTVSQRLSYLPLERLDSLKTGARSGDLACFVSHRPDLDVFHVGLLKAGNPVGLRHASRSAGQVIEEDLDAFLARNEALGLMVGRLVGPLMEG